MRQIDRYKKIEIELTSHCNLVCPGCTRTWQGATNPRLTLSSIPYEIFVNQFTPDVIKNKVISFCGVYGDPLMHKDFFEIVEHCLKSKSKRVIVDTNASLRSVEWWQQFGELSENSNYRLKVNFSVDGHKETNHLYRVNSNFEKIRENIKAYTDAGGWGIWKYIVFPHNQNEIDLARQEAKKLKVDIKFDKNTRAPDSFWPTYEKIKEQTNNADKLFEELDAQDKNSINYTKKHVIEKFNTTAKVHSKKEFTKKITCEWLEESALFVGYDGKVWPCCYFHHDYHQYYLRPDRNKKWMKTGKYLHKLDNDYGKDWNDINNHDLEKILSNKWYTNDLKKSLSTNPTSCCTFNCEK